MNDTYDIVMREEDFVLYRNNKPLLTPQGNETKHTNSRLLRMVITSEIAGKNNGLQAIEILKQITDNAHSSKLSLNCNNTDIIHSDPLLQNRLNLKINNIEKLLDKQPWLFDFVFLNSSSLVSALNAFLSKKEANNNARVFLLETINDLTTEQKIVLEALYSRHKNGVLVHLLLLKGYLSISEYVAALIVLEIKNDSKETLEYINIKHFTEHSNQLTQNALVATDFITLCNETNKLSVIEEIIRRGENGKNEFKSTLRWDLHQAKKSPDIEHASLKTINAFLNSEGGDLLIGVRDDGSIEGIETDQFKNNDKFLLHLWTLIKTTMGQEVIEWVKTSLQHFGDKTVCRVNCKKATKPVFLNHKNSESFYVRVGPASNKLEIRAALKYIEEHF